jgi:hypothetical protein
MRGRAATQEFSVCVSGSALILMQINCAGKVWNGRYYRLRALTN